MPATRIKPGKPYPSFPLTAHTNGQWCKAIRGKVHPSAFGPIRGAPWIAISPAQPTFTPAEARRLSYRTPTSRSRMHVTPSSIGRGTSSRPGRSEPAGSRTVASSSGDSPPRSGRADPSTTFAPKTPSAIVPGSPSSLASTPSRGTSPQGVGNLHALYNYESDAHLVADIDYKVASTLHGETAFGYEVNRNLVTSIGNKWGEPNMVTVIILFPCEGGRD